MQNDWANLTSGPAFSGGAIYLEGTGALIGIFSSTVEGNHTYNGKGEGIAANLSGHFSIRDTLIAGNVSSQDTDGDASSGGGIWAKMTAGTMGVFGKLDRLR